MVTSLPKDSRQCFDVFVLHYIALKPHAGKNKEVCYKQKKNVYLSFFIPVDCK